MADEQLLRALRALEPGERLVIPLQGSSMEPTLREGDEICLEKISPDQARWGDLIAFFDRHHQLIVHRLIWRWQVYITKGDNKRTRDHPMNAQSMMARVIHIQRQGETVGSPHASSRLRALVSLGEYLLAGMLHRLRRLFSP